MCIRDSLKPIGGPHLWIDILPVDVLPDDPGVYRRLLRLRNFLEMQNLASICLLYTSEWGAMLSGMREVVRTYPLGVLVPGITITLVVMSFSLVGDGLRDALDPKLKNN